MEYKEKQIFLTLISEIPYLGYFFLDGLKKFGIVIKTVMAKGCAVIV